MSYVFCFFYQSVRNSSVCGVCVCVCVLAWDALQAAAPTRLNWFFLQSFCAKSAVPVFLFASSLQGWEYKCGWNCFCYYEINW